MKLKDFEQNFLGDKRYSIEDFKYPNMPFTRFNHLILDTKTGRRFLTVKVKDDEIAFIEVYDGEYNGKRKWER